MTHLEQISLSQTISKVDALIDAGNGDSGRLYHILEFLKNNRPLYHSDKIYLENKLQSSFSVEEESVELDDSDEEIIIIEDEEDETSEETSQENAAEAIEGLESDG